MLPDFSPPFFVNKYIGGIPHDWSWKDLSKISTPKQWATISQSEMTEVGFPVYGANGKIGYFHTYNHTDSVIAISCRGACGDVHLTEPKSYVTGNAMCLDGVTKDIDQDFLYFALIYRTVEDAISGSAQPQITRESLKGVLFPSPPLPEQKKIAAILTSVDEVIDATQKQIDKLQDLKKATMNELLTKGIGHTEFKDSELGMIPKSWEVRALGEILDLKNGVNTDKDAFGSGSPFITYMDVHSGNDLDETVLRKFVKLSAKENEAFSVKFGDVFFTRTSETPEEIGLSNTYLGRDVGAVFNGFCIRGRPKSKLLSAKLSKYLFRSEYIRTQMKLLCKYTTRAGISGESLNRCLIALPPMNEQFISENTIISFDKDLRLKEIKLAQTQSLKKSLMQDLLTGKVRVKVD